MEFGFYKHFAPSGARIQFPAGGTLELDLSVVKSFAFSSQQELSVKADIFNFINRANFGIPNRFLGAVGFGEATNTITPGAASPSCSQILFLRFC